MTISDNDLMMLEQLTYLNKDVLEAAGIEGNLNYDNCRGKTIGEILEKFDDDAIRKLQENSETVDYVEAKEWASIISYMKNSDLSNLTLDNTMTHTNSSTGKSQTAALCFTDGSGEAVVAFQGTLDGSEWVDNVEGLNQSDTENQKEALDYIESLPYDHITVTGHSKGANKAMYCTILSDKVDRCVAMDGQGFSPEFMEKYHAEIIANADKINEYSVSEDFVHILLFPIPGSHQYYCVGYGRQGNIGENHSANSMFRTDENGNLILDENGQPIVDLTSEDSSIAILRKFVEFVEDNAPDSDKAKIVAFLGELMSMSLGSGKSVTVDDIIAYLREHQEDTAIVVAYLLKFVDVYDLDVEDILKILTALCGKENLDSIIEKAGITANMLIPGITDGSLWLRAILDVVFSCMGFDMSSFWDQVSHTRTNSSTFGKFRRGKVEVGSVHDFASDTYQALLEVFSVVGADSFPNIGGWSSYSGNKWYSELGISRFKNGVNKFAHEINETNSLAKEKITVVFENVYAADSTFGSELANAADAVNTMIQTISTMTDNIG